MRIGIFPAVAAMALSVSVAGCGDGAQASAGAPLEQAEIAAIQQLCETVSIQYARALDGKDPEALSMAFAEDGVWEVLSNRMEGRDEIRGYWEMRLADWTPTHGRLHQIANQVIEVVDADHARGTSYALVYFFDTEDGANKELAPALIAKNHDEFVRTEDGWKLKHRRVERVANVAAE